MKNLSYLQRKGQPWVAMIAAYAVALQMLLTAAVAGQMAAAPPGSSPICYGAALTHGEEQDGVTPLYQASCILCSVGLSTSADPVVASVTPAYCWKDVFFEDHAASPSLAQAPPSPRLSQGPPQTV